MITPKRTLKIWQVVIIEVILATILSTMFLPFFRITGSGIKSMYSSMKDVVEKSADTADDESVKSALESWLDNYDESAVDDVAESFDKWMEDDKVQEVFELAGVTPTYISGWQLMTFDPLSGLKERISKERYDNYEEYLSAISPLKVMLWILYITTLILIILTCISYVMDLIKFIPLGVSIGYGAYAGVFFSYVIWMLPGRIASSIEGVVGVFIGNSAIRSITDASDEGDAYVEMAGYLKKMVSAGLASLRSPFVLIAFILCCVLVVFAIVSMFIFNKSAASDERGDNSLDSADVFGADPFGDAPVPTSSEPMPMRGFTETATVFDPNIGTPVPDEEPDYFGGQTVPVNAEVQPMTASPQRVSPPPVHDPGIVPLNAPVSRDTVPMGRVEAISGVVTGDGYRFPETRKIIVGSDSGSTTLTINARFVSKIHCSIRYKATTNTYIVKDHSTNGTFVNGRPMQKGVPSSFPAGTVISLADGKNQLKLG